jgi:hypothetical protein
VDGSIDGTPEKKIGSGKPGPGRKRIFPGGAEQSRSNAAKKARARLRKQKANHPHTRKEKARANVISGKTPTTILEKNLADRGVEFDEDGLTVQERIYVEHFLAYGNKRKARIAAGIDANNIELGQRPKVVEVIKRELEERREKFKLTSEGTIEKLQWLVNFDPALLFRVDGSPIPLNQLPVHIRYCIDGLEVEDIHEGRGEERRWVGRLVKYKYSHKMHAIIAAMKHQKLLDGSGATNKDRLEEILNAWRSGPVKKVMPVLEGQEIKHEPGT